METNKNKGGFLSGVVHLFSMLLFLVLIYEAIKWIFTSSIGEKLIFLAVLVMFFLFYTWGTTLM